ARTPSGSVPSHMPKTMAVTGKVASPLSGASTAPTMLAVETITVLLPPASACATASTIALRRASVSSGLMCWYDCGAADIGRAPGGRPLWRRSPETANAPSARQDLRGLPLAGRANGPRRVLERHRAGVANARLPRLGDGSGPDLAQ